MSSYQTETFITDPAPYVTYISVLAYNSEGDGPHSTPINVTTGL